MASSATTSPVTITRVHTLVIGSGAAGLNAAVQLDRQGIRDMLILTDGLNMGTSINTGSDKQTYYKLSLCGDHPDSPRLMAQNYFEPGCMHGDLALVEAALSPRAFMHLVGLGMKFPQDRFGQFVGYKTDHDPFARATSIGPYTSREMCRALIREVERRQIRVQEKSTVVELVTMGRGPDKRVCGAVAMDTQGALQAFMAENIIFAVGGPGGLFRDSVYPPVHTGAIGLALRAGAAARNLHLFQFGLASTKFRWNVSGTYMQVIPRLVSTAPDSTTDAREFLHEYFPKHGRMHSLVFLKGYQWPFDPRKVIGGSSIIDLLVYRETVLRGRRVFLDYRTNPAGFALDNLASEAREYLVRSGAHQDSPIARLQHMNPDAIALYAEHGIDLTQEMLEIAVSAQHNNGGLAANIWWESENVRHLFPVGEVNGSHGIARPGGSALNSGQAGGIRAAEFIAQRYADWSLDEELARVSLERAAEEITGYLAKSGQATMTWKQARDELQQRMSAYGAHVRDAERLGNAIIAARAQIAELESRGCRADTVRARIEVLRNRQLCLSHLVYLEAMRFSLESGAGSQGSSLVLDTQGEMIPGLPRDEWRFAPENPQFRNQVLRTVHDHGKVEHEWLPRRPIPGTDTWFETAWSAFRNGDIYEDFLT